MTEFSLEADGMADLQRRMGDLQIYLGRNIRDAVKKGAYEASRSLIARTRPTNRKSYRGPEIALATQADVDLLASIMHIPQKWPGSQDGFRRYVQTLASVAYVARSDRPKDSRRGGLRHVNIWRRDKFGKAQLKKILAYGNSGLAKASWRWCASKSKGGKAASMGGKRDGIIVNNCSVRPTEGGMAIIIDNRLSYIRSALISPSAINDALRMAAKSIKGQIERKIGQEIA